MEGRQNIALGNDSGKDFLQSTGVVVIGNYSGESDTAVSLNNSIILASGADSSSKLILNSSGALSFSDVYTGASYGSAGQVLQSNGPAARPTWVNAGGFQTYPIARRSTRTVNTSSGGNAVVVYDVADTSNPVAFYNATNGRFQPTLAGFWNIQATARCFATSTAETSVTLLKNNTTRLANVGAFGQVAGTVSTTVFLNGVSDFVVVDIYTAVASSNSQTNSYFSAFYVGN
jgi:hypothetical protein